MYAVKENTLKLPDGTIIDTFSRDILNHNVLEVEAGTTGYLDAKYEAATYFKIRNGGCTLMQAKLINDDEKEGFEVILRGDAELETTIRALKFIVKVLEDQTHKVCD